MAATKENKKSSKVLITAVVSAAVVILSVTAVGAYFGLSEASNRNADEQAVVQMNKMLETYEVISGKITSVEIVKDIFEKNGLNSTKPFFDKNTFYWTRSEARILIWEEDKGVTFPSYMVETYKSNSKKLETSATWYDISII